MFPTSWSSMLLEHRMSVAHPLGWSCREVMQFPRSLSPGISGVKTSRLFLGERPAKTELVITLKSIRISWEIRASADVSHSVLQCHRLWPSLWGWILLESLPRRGVPADLDADVPPSTGNSNVQWLDYFLNKMLKITRLNYNPLVKCLDKILALVPSTIIT